MKKIVSLVILFSLTLLPICPLYPQGKGGRWEFENNVGDSASWDIINDSGALQNQAGFDNASPLQQGSAYLRLDNITGAHNFFLVQDSEDLDFDNENIGISAWIYPLVLDDVHYLVNKGEQSRTPKTTNYALRISLNKELEFLIRDANNQARRVTSGFTIAENEWTFVAAYYDYSAGKIYMWNDPAAPPVDTLDFSQEFFSNNDPLAIGSWYRETPDNPSIKDFKGRMDDVRISGRMEDILPQLTGIELQEGSTPGRFSLRQNFPNPFNPATTIVFDIARAGKVNLVVYNSVGQQVATLVNQYLAAGRYSVPFKAAGLASGVYFYQVTAGRFRQIRKMLILR